MGMYDHVKFSMNCPICGYDKNEFQTKDGHCVLDTLKPEKVKDFYTLCDSCRCWIGFSRLDNIVAKHMKKINKENHYYKFGKYLYSCRVSFDWYEGRDLKRKETSLEKLMDKLKEGDK